MAYSSDYSNSQDVTLQSRVRMSMLVQAAAISSEVNTTANHVSRSTLATKVSNSPDTWVQPFSQTACAGGTVTIASIDSVIDARISAVWNLLSGGL